MKIGVIGDVHWSRYSSILRNRGEKYSYRLENCIQSINWAETITKDCDNIVYLGDFFDSSELNSEEITALKDITWNNKEHHFLVGNHEMGINDLSHSSSHIFDYIKLNSSYVEDSPNEIVCGDTILTFIPYILEENRKNIDEYFQHPAEKRIIFSHNDIAGVQLGKFISNKGFSIEEIQQHCDIFLNGHLHNGGKVADKIINVGNLTGQNFSEDALIYDHSIIILDTDTLQCAVYENPFAINFYKLDSIESTIDINSLKQNAVVTLKTTLDNQSTYKDVLDNSDKVVTSRIIIAPSNTENTVANNKELLAVNHLDKFSDYVLTTLGTSNIVKEELTEVLS